MKKKYRWQARNDAAALLRVERIRLHKTRYSRAVTRIQNKQKVATAVLAHTQEPLL